MLLTLLFAAASVSCSSTLHLRPLCAPSRLWLIRRQTPPLLHPHVLTSALTLQSVPTYAEGKHAYTNDHQRYRAE